jgi:putative oxidoreductase
MDMGFLLLRLIVELILTSHGTRKLFGWFGGPGRRHAAMAGLEETGGGLLLALALLTLTSGDHARYRHQSGIGECPND